MSTKSRKKGDKTEATIPQGEWEYFSDYDIGWSQDIYTISVPLLEDFITVHRNKNTPEQDELVAKLIIDAGNTYQKCNKLPSELLESHTKLLDMLESLIVEQQILPKRRAEIIQLLNLKTV